MSRFGWWNDLEKEKHIVATQADLKPATRNADAFFRNYSAPEIAQWIERGLVDGWPLEFTQKGRAWWRNRPTISSHTRR